MRKFTLLTLTFLLSLGLLACADKPEVIREDVVEERNEVEIVETEEDVNLDVVEQVGDVDSTDEEVEDSLLFEENLDNEVEESSSVEVEDDIIIQGAF